MKVYVDAACDIKYASFYVEGIRRFTGGMPQFTSSYFGQFELNNHYFPLVVAHQNGLSKIIIDFADGWSIDSKAYEWCDLYAKVNIDFADADRYEKLFSIGPSFGIRTFSPVGTVFYSIVNFLKAKHRIPNTKTFFANYNSQRLRFSIGHYRNDKKSSNDYVFFASSLWKSEPETNAFRANFIRACQKILGPNFEGGFAPRTRNDVPGYEDLTLSGRIGESEYFDKLRDSMAVFNTPAVLQCHGWKLGEFMALNKAIISTPLARKLPKNLVDGEDFLLTDGTQSDMEHKIRLLLDNPELKVKLERASIAYYNDFVAPEKVISLIFGQLGIK
ncbi:hypothetical protein [Flavobacterium sp.]|uniref:hypothetical protein n=1 Tax=Flavobacterium sp. TaxID=239 RepID=UPI0039E26BC8